MARIETFVIVGASLAGAKAAESLRSEGFEGRVVLCGEEPERPYERPALSKEYLRGTQERDGLFVHPAPFYDDQGIELRTSARVTEIRPGTSEVVLADGERLRFDRLLLATGAMPRRLDVPGADLDGVLHLRTLADADAIAERVARGERAVMVGGGWIGAEIAASARQQGCDVTVIERSRLPLERVLGREVAAIYRDVHVEHGVRLVTDAGVEALRGAGRVERVVTTGGHRFECDFVVVGVGAVARTELAERAGIAVGGGGILVDEHLRTSVPDVFAAGDVANAWHPHYATRLRVEHWANALHQGPVAAKGMLGDAGAIYDRLPYFYSDQYELAMEYRGHATSWDDVVFRGDPAGRSFLAFFVSGGRVAAAMNVNVARVGRPLQALIRRRVAVTARDLADPDVPLESLAEGATGSRFAASRARRRDAPPTSATARPPAVERLRRGEGTVLELDGEPVAIHRRDDGGLHAISAVCTHLGCVVDFNPVERTWDCPCHGARYTLEGRVFRGPAERDLEPSPAMDEPLHETSIASGEATVAR